MANSWIKMEAGAVSTLGTGGTLKRVFRPEKISKIDKVLIAEKRPLTVLGGLSNVLVLSGGVETPVILTDRMQGHHFEDNVLFARAGEKLAKLCKATEERGLTGLENLCGIPGTVGGAVMGNSGSFGSAVSDTLESVDLYRLDNGELEELTRDEIAFSYRHCNLRRDLDLIVGVRFRLYPYERSKITARMQEVQALRRENQPKGLSLGSVFRRCGEISAGYYIEKAGLKGYAEGGMKFSEKHANFIINTGDGTPEAYLSLMELAEKKVYETFGIKLRREVVIIGERKNTCENHGGTTIN